MNVHLLSPIIYIFYTKSFLFFKPCPKSNLMIKMRTAHNIILCLLSLIMFVGILYSNYKTSKLNSIHNILCKSYNNDSFSLLNAHLFLYSKYLEWGDTLFLHLSGKQISMLQYTHHMSTAFLVYLNTMDFMNSHYLIPMALNCFVHFWMYLYFAFPKGILKYFRKQITQIQIIQHIICIITSIYINTLHNCHQNKYGNKCGLLLYLIYLFYFSVFYINVYFKKLK